MKKYILGVVAMFVALSLSAQEVDSTAIFIDQIEKSMEYQTGEIQFDSIGVLNVPSGFKFLDAEQSEYVLTELWGNPTGECLGILLREQDGVLTQGTYVFILTYDNMGYVKDDDADDIDYDDLLEEMVTDTKASSEERVKEGYGPVELVGWASEPFYDSDKKTLHWAKEISFDGDSVHTLNYNVRILGRKGVLVMNAVAGMPSLAEVKSNINNVHSSFTFSDGLQYKDFDPGIDEVAAWTIGGLVAGKVLAKVGIFAIVLKYIKVIGLGVVALGTGIYKWFTRRREENPYANRDSGQTPPAA